MTRDSHRDAPTLIEHLERTLGPIHTGWSVDSTGAEMRFQVVRFSGGPDADSVAYSTLGLSRYPLPSPTSGRVVRHELLMLAPEALAPDQIVSLLHDVGAMALDAPRALLRGDVIGPAGAVTPGSDLNALYVTMPVYFPDGFATFADPDGDVVVAWLVPITTREADFISRRGWDAFEDKLVEQDPDLVDFQRSGMNL